MSATPLAAELPAGAATSCGPRPADAPEHSRHAAGSAVSIRVRLHGRPRSLQQVGELGGQPVFSCQSGAREPFPAYAERRRLRRRLAPKVSGAIVVFTDVSGLLEVWQWEDPVTERISLYREATVRGDDDRRDLLEHVGPPVRRQSASEPCELSTPSSRNALHALLRGLRRRSAGVLPPGWFDDAGQPRRVRLSNVFAWVEESEQPEVVRALWRCLLQFRVFDARCGTGERLVAVAGILAPLYAACLQRIQVWVDELGRARTAHRPEKLRDFRRLLAHTGDRRIYEDRTDFIVRSILSLNLYGADPDPGDVALARYRLLGLLGAGAATSRLAAPLNLLVGDAALGFWTHGSVAQALRRSPDLDARLRRLEETAESIQYARDQLRRTAEPAGGEEGTATAAAAIEQRLQQLREELDALAADRCGESGSAMPADPVSTRLHRPLHGWLEFYGVVRRGGFDLVLGERRGVAAARRRTPLQLQRPEHGARGCAKDRAASRTETPSTESLPSPSWRRP
jgi:hypothetical protein